MNNMKQNPLTNTKLSMLSRAVGVVAGVLAEAVERGDGGVGGDGVVGTNVEDVGNLKSFILLEDEP